MNTPLQSDIEILHIALEGIEGNVSDLFNGSVPVDRVTFEKDPEKKEIAICLVSFRDTKGREILLRRTIPL